MSQWTHVAACIRFDGLRIPGFPSMLPDLSDPPMGSEGPLKVEVWQNPEPNHMAAWTVTVHGDLRHFGENYEKDVGIIVDWLTRICVRRDVKKPILIRQGICQIEVEYKPTMVLMWESGEPGAEINGRWVSIHEKVPA